MSSINQIAEILILGLIGGAAPGPIMMSVFTEILNGGFGKGVKIIMRALVAETVIAVLMLSVVYFLNIPRFYFEIISLLGAAFLLYLASGIWKINELEAKKGEVFTFSRVFVLTILNSGFAIYWLTVCVPLAFALGRQIHYGEAVFVLAFETGWLISTLFLSFVFSRFRPLLVRRKLVGMVFKLCALTLVFFAVKTAWSSIVFFVG